MTSVAERRRNRAKTGRPRKEGVDRFECGKIKPAETQKETMSVAIEARERHHGQKIDVGSPFAGYVLGRIFLDGKITEDQRKAGDEYAETIARYHRLVGIPFPSARAQSLFTIKGYDGDVTEDMAAKARRATNRMMEVTGILLGCTEGPVVRAVVHNVSVMDYDHLRGMQPQSMLWLRRGLQALWDKRTIA